MIETKIILASKSPRRSQLLTWAEIPYEIITIETDETFPENLEVKKVAEYLAIKKAENVRNLLVQQDKKAPIAPVLSADTVVIIDNEILGKPASRAEAIQMLMKLSGNVHEVMTGVCFLAEGRRITFSEKTIVEFHKISKKEITHYVDNYNPLDKAGSYAIQEWIGVIGIKSIQGDFYNVMGLPISRVVQELKKLVR